MRGHLQSVRGRVRERRKIREVSWRVQSLENVDSRLLEGQRSEMSLLEAASKTVPYRIGQE